MEASGFGATALYHFQQWKVSLEIFRRRNCKEDKTENKRQVRKQSSFEESKFCVTYLSTVATTAELFNKYE
jgi:hypothetical protein